MTDDENGGKPRTVGQLFGDKLRAVRKEKGLSLLAVEAMTGDEFKASVLGAYERGERAITMLRMVALAKAYELPVARLLPSFAFDGARPTMTVHIDGDLDLVVERDGQTRQIVA